ncbi:MAG TPA: ABC transporter permease subunit, partial [Beijerinckiaceae bacterium]|nr:ABC transporter permease subunit [Beijerinckiaceae bacterium]
MSRLRWAAPTIQFLCLAAAFAAWYGLTATQSVSPLFLPTPASVGNSLLALVKTNAFWSAVSVTLATIAEAYAIAIAAGLATAYLVTRSRFLTDTMEPLLAGLFTIPITLFFPMFILFFGVGTGSKIAYGAVYGFFPIALNTIAAFANFESRYLDAARSMGASRADTFRHVLLPGALPVIANGMRIGFFIAFASVLGGEVLS